MVGASWASGEDRLLERCLIRGGRPSVWAVLLLRVTHASGGAAETTGAAGVSPLIVFAPEFAARANPSTSAEGNATLVAIRSDPAASHVRTGRSAPAAIAAALDARVLSVVVPASADGPEAVLAFTGVDVEHNADPIDGGRPPTAACEGEGP